MSRRNNIYVDFDNEKLQEEYNKLWDKIYKAVGKDLNNLLEMERELTLREEI